MSVPATISEFLDLVRKSKVAEEKHVEAHVEKLRAEGKLPSEPGKLAGLLVRDGFLTHFQAEQILQGKWKRFTIGKYKVLERLGSGGMGSVYLCEHKLMRRRVAVKVLPAAKANDEASLKRFYREAQAAAALDHPHIVHAYDIDRDENLHFLVMEYVDGASLQEIVSKTGPMDPVRASHYISQAALGLEHAYQSGLVHRDIKPGNILVDRSGIVKILDIGLARFFNDQDDILTRKYEENVLGTADYMAPEQAIDSHTVDIRADIYSLGATFYFLLLGRTPFGEGTVGQKLLWLQSRLIKPVAEFRPEVPPALSAIICRMMEKDAAKRYQGPIEVAEALAPWIQTPIAPPLETEMPHLSLAATGVSPSEQTVVSSSVPRSPSPTPQKIRQAPGYLPAGGPGASPLSPSPQPVVAVAPPVTPLLPAPPPAPEPLAEEIPWETMAPETFDPAAHLDTASESASRLAVQAKAAWAWDWRRLRRLALLFTVVSLVALLITSWIFFRRAESELPIRPNLQVSKNATGPFAFRTIDQALRKAERGDIIELVDGVQLENLVIDPRRKIATEITIQAAPGKEVTWKPRRDDWLLYLSKAQGFTLKGPGLTLDGTMSGNRYLKNLLFITLDCPGLTLDNIRLQGYSQHAIQVANCAGDQKRPVRLMNLQAAPAPGEKSEAAIFLNANTKEVVPSTNDFLEISNINAAKAVKFKDKSVLGPNVRLPR